MGGGIGCAKLSVYALWDSYLPILGGGGVVIH